MLKQLRHRKRELRNQNRKKRRVQWDDDTPLIRLVNLQQIDVFKAMLKEWEKHNDGIPIPLKSSQFHFSPPGKPHIIRALAKALNASLPLFRISILQLCRYLSLHSNLGSASVIRQALYRAKRALTKID
ncbi:MAG: hypothetical protein II864_03835 [Prevotella sp.]|nr:hypothetical protein [Prevotella sp.]MBQ6768309.1 hypothetical protein [Prevotella sp.]